MKKIFVTILFLFLSSQSFASHDDHNHKGDVNSLVVSDSKKVLNTNCKNRVDIDVNGLVCDFCARAVEKVFSKKEEVSAIDVDLDAGKIIIAMKEDQTIDNDLLKKLITDSGYDVVKINKGCNE